MPKGGKIMTKIEHTKTHRIVNSKNNFPNGQTIDYGTQVLVTDAELVLVECEEVKHAILHNIINKNGKFYKPIYISRTEKIVDGDFYYDHINNLIKRFDPMYDCLSSKDGKVLALPVHFSPQQLQDIVDGKLKEGKCLVECEQEEPIPMTYKGVDSRGDYIYYCPKCGYGGSYMGAGQVHCYKDECRPTTIKLNPHITIYSVEEKVYTRLEVRTILHKFNNPQSNEDVFKLNTWFEQNVK